MTTPTDVRIIPHKGGKVLRRATVAALNLVPGTFGRYRVDRCGPEAAILSERLSNGWGPLFLAAPGAILWPTCPLNNSSWARESCSIPNRAEQEADWPLKRQGAIIGHLTGDDSLRAGYSDAYSTGILTGISGLRDGSLPSINGSIWGITGIPAQSRWNNGCAVLVLQEALVKGTYIGNRSATFTRSNREVRKSCSAILKVHETLDGWCGIVSVPEQRRVWARALVAGYAESGESPAPPEALAEIGLRAEIWNHTTDPGGEGEQSGAENADVEAVEESGWCSHCGPDGDNCAECLAYGECSGCDRALPL